MSVLSIIQSSNSSSRENIQKPPKLLLKPKDRPTVYGYTPSSWYHFHLRTIVLWVLPLLSLSGGYFTWMLAGRNGTLGSLVLLLDQEKPTFPGTLDLLVTHYTGVKRVDRQLAILVAAWAPVVSGQNLELTLWAVMGFGQFGAVWTLMMMEGLRMGNRRKVVNLITFIGLLIQNFSFVLVAPIWLWLHLLSSPVAKPFPGTHANSVLLIQPWDLKILPTAILLGYILPSILMSLPPSLATSELHQKYISFWQLFPLWTTFIHYSLKKCCECVVRRMEKRNKRSRTPTPRATHYLSNAGYVYRFVLGLCMVTHIPILLLTLLPSSLFQLSIITTSATLDGMALPLPGPKLLTTLLKPTFTSVYIPYFPLPSYQVSSLAEGVHVFLLWDLFLGSIAFLLWAILLYRNATTEKAIVDPTTTLPIYRELLAGEKERGEWNGGKMLWRKLCMKICVWWVVSGPIGALAVLLWERDAIVRQKIKQGI